VAARGTEGVLRDELRELGVPLVKATRGGVHFGGDFLWAARVCLQSRIAVRVLQTVAQFKAENADELYQGVYRVEWEQVLAPSMTLAVHSNLRSSALTHSAFVSLKVKDAIVDRLRERAGKRPDIDRRDPDLLVNVHLVNNQAELLLDLSGEPLHRRGYRLQGGDAPLKETLAACMLRLSGWNRETLLVDPMCGSGTIVIEAALQAQGIAPGLGRKRFGFERWASHDSAQRAQTAELRALAREIANVNEPAMIVGKDRDPSVLSIARANARRAGVRVRFERAEVAELRIPARAGYVIINPPYGVRLSEGAALIEQIAQAFRRLSGFRVCALVADRKLPTAMRVRPIIEHELWNGDIDCRLFCWDIP
jgi:23S rRNA G2445 N2-methylase RlmL